MSTTSQDPNPQKTDDPILAAAKREAELAEARQKKATAEKDEAEAVQGKLKAQLMPQGDQSATATPSGDVTTDGSGFAEVEMLGQEAARRISIALKEALCRSAANIKTLVIYNAAEIARLAEYASIFAQIEEFNMAFEANKKEIDQTLATVESFLSDPDFVAGEEMLAYDLMTALAVPTIATGVVKSVAEFVNLFRSTTDYKKKTISLTEDMIVSYIVERVVTSPCAETVSGSGGKLETIYYPEYFPPNIIIAGNSALATMVNDLRAKNLQLKETVSGIDANIDRITNESTSVKADSDSKAVDLAAKEKELSGLPESSTEHEKIKGEIKGLKDEIAKLKAKLNRYSKNLTMLKNIKPRAEFMTMTAEQLITNLNTPDSTTKFTPLAQLIKAEKLISILKQDTTFTLRLTIAANGTTKIKKRLFLDARIKHSAGAILTYQLFDVTGKVVLADVIQYYFDWKTAEEVRSTIKMPAFDIASHTWL